VELEQTPPPCSPDTSEGLRFTDLFSVSRSRCQPAQGAADNNTIQLHSQQQQPTAESSPRLFMAR